MSDLTDSPLHPQRRWMRLLCRIVLGLLGFFVVSSVLSLFTVPFHLAFGWIGHLHSNAPSLLGQWPKLLLLLACLVVAIGLVHRLIRWRLAARGPSVDWRWRNTLAATAIVLSGPAATVALSGMAHQVAWLSDKPLYERRGMDVARSHAIYSARVTLHALESFYRKRGRYPDSLEELSLPYESTMVSPLPGMAPEPLVYFKPNAAADPDSVTLVSPVLRQNEMVIIGYLPSETEVHPASKLAGILETRRKPASEVPER